jgi:hypothetical protein
VGVSLSWARPEPTSSPIIFDQRFLLKNWIRRIVSLAGGPKNRDPPDLYRPLFGGEQVRVSYATDMQVRDIFHPEDAPFPKAYLSVALPYVL